MTPDDPSPKPSGRTPGMAFIFITMFLDVVGMGISIPVMPQWVASFTAGNLSHASIYIGATVALYTLVQFLCAPLLGALSDRYGRKPVLLFSLLVTALAYMATALAPSLGWLLAARALGGLGGASITVASTYIADVSPPERRAQNFGLSGVAFGLGFIAGPAIGGLLGTFGTRVPFYVAGAVALVNTLYGLLVVPESHHAANRRAFSLATANPIGSLALLRKYPLVLGLAGSMIWFGLAQQCLQSNWVVYTTYRFGWTPAQNGLSLAVVGISAAFVQGYLIRLVLPLLGERRAVAIGLGLNTMAMALYGLATHGWMMFAILLGSGLAGISGPALQAQISKQVGPQEQGGIQGALTSLMCLTGVFGPLLANGLFGFFTSPHAPFQLPGVAFLLGSLLSLVALASTLKVFARHPEVPAVATEPSLAPR